MTSESCSCDLMRGYRARRPILDDGTFGPPQVLTARIIPTDTLVVPDQETIQPLPDLVGEALRKRPDLAGAGIQVENSQISLEGSLNALKPSLNLVGTIQNSGMAGRPGVRAGRRKSDWRRF